MRNKTTSLITLLCLGSGLCSGAEADAASRTKLHGEDYVMPVYRVSPHARDPFFLREKSQPAEQKATSVSPAYAHAPGPLTPQKIKAEVELQAVMANGQRSSAIINGSRVALGEVVSLDLDGRLVDLTLVEVSASPLQVVLAVGNEKVTCSLSSGKRR